MFYYWHRHVSGNNLTGTLPPALFEQPNMKTLFLNFNKFSCPIDERIVEALNKETPSNFACILNYNEFEIIDGKLCGKYTVFKKCLFLPTIGMFPSFRIA